MTNQKQKHNPSPKVKSTPGPWGCYIEEAGRDHLAAKSAYVINSESENRYPKHYENQANAHLIAAAPELLGACNALHDALSAILEDTDNTILGTSLRKQANKAVNISFRAIAKAEGGE